MIVDCFMFDDEFDMLDCRIYELRGVVDLFVAVESDHTFTGIEKPYWLTEEVIAGRYQHVPLQVIRASTADGSGPSYAGDWVKPDTEAFWGREERQRNAADELINDLAKDDIVIIGDLDEIPRRDFVERFALEQQGFIVGANLIFSARLTTKDGRNGLPQLWAASYISRRRYMKPRTSTEARNSRTFVRPLAYAGWHLSWFGTPEDRIRKYQHSAHQELGIGDRIGEEIPSRREHVDGRELTEWWGDVPAWVADGHAPESWYKEWEAS